MTRQDSCEWVNAPPQITNFKYNTTTYNYASLVWDGRQLASLVLVGSYGPVYKIDFEYNDQGYRTAKIKSAWVNYAWSQTERIDYELIDDKIIYETNGTYGLLFSYDYDGKIISFNGDLNVNDTTPGQEYFYLRNQQGDITTIVDEDGLAIVKYRYDAYGNTTVVSDLSEGIVSFYNPYTYRGYRYDSEIGMYYLNSRFYNPQIGRFLNGDGLLGQTGDIFSTNMYAYCANNPVQYTDEYGYFWHIVGGALIGAAVGATIQILTNCISGDKWYNDLGGAILGGAVGGALTAMGVPSVVVGLSVGLATGIGNQIDDACANWQCDISKVSVAEIVADGIVSGVFAGFGSSFANNVVGYSAKQVANWFKPQSLFKFLTGGFGEKIASMIVIGSVPNVITSGIDSVTTIPDFEEIVTDVWNYITSSK